MLLVKMNEFDQQEHSEMWNTIQTQGATPGSEFSPPFPGFYEQLDLMDDDNGFGGVDRTRRRLQVEMAKRSGSTAKAQEAAVGPVTRLTVRTVRTRPTVRSVRIRPTPWGPCQLSTVQRSTVQRSTVASWTEYDPNKTAAPRAAHR